MISESVNVIVTVNVLQFLFINSASAIDMLQTMAICHLYTVVRWPLNRGRERRKLLRRTKACRRQWLSDAKQYRSVLRMPFSKCRPIDFQLRKYSVATVKMIVQNWFGLLQEIQAVENALRKNTLGEHGVSTVTLTDQCVLHARFVFNASTGGLQQLQ